ncbi:MAG: hypothetical protein GY859_15620 [Desulfobacterales bacterium]|nr:hypothetical protein [Desulfobacterales bacterium]
MKRLFASVGEKLNKTIDPSRYLLIGAAFGKFSVFVYEENGTRPFAVVKVPGNEEGDAQCANEYRCMEYLHRKKIPGVKSARPLGIIENDDRKCYLYGTLFSDPFYSMLPLLTRVPKKRYFQRVTGMLIRMHHHSRQSENIPGKSYALCFKHGDLWAGNLGGKGGDIVLYDLEFGCLEGKPLFDLLHFCLYYRVVVNNIGAVGGDVVTGDYDRDREKRVFKPSAETVRGTFMMNNRLSRITRRCVRDYVRSCGISVEDARALIFEYFHDDRGVKGLEPNFEEKIHP